MLAEQTLSGFGNITTFFQKPAWKSKCGFYFCDEVAKTVIVFMIHPSAETRLADSEVNESTLVSLGDSRADYLGVGGSFLCLIHCLAPQVLATLGSVGLGIGTFFESELWVLFFWISCLAAVWSATRKSAFPKVGMYLWLAFILFSIGTGLEFFFHLDHTLSYLGSSLLIIGHLYHLYLQQNLLRTRPLQCVS